MIIFSLDWWKSTLWIQQLAALLTIIAIPYAFLKLVIYKAKHKIFFSPAETYHERLLSGYPGNPKSYWLQLMVKNEGFEMSRNAEAYLTEVWKKNSKNPFQKLDGFLSPVKLKWSHEADIFPIDILPRKSRRLDVCYIYQDNNILHIVAKGHPSGSIQNELPPGEYIFVIEIVSESKLVPARFLFQVTWDGQWRTLVGKKYVESFKMYKEPVKSFTIY